MSQTIDSSIIGAIGNFAIAVLVGLGLKGRIDALAKTVVYKDTCKTCGNGTDKELTRVHAEIILLRTTQDSNHKEQIKMLMEIYKTFPKRDGD